MTIKGPESSRQPGISKNDPLYFFLNKSKVRIFDPSTGQAAEVYQPEKPFANIYHGKCLMLPHPLILNHM